MLGHVPTILSRVADQRRHDDQNESALQTRLDKFEPARSGSMHDAQLNLPGGDAGWSTIMDWIQVVGPPLSALRQERSIGPAKIDLAIPFDDEMAALSIDLPSGAAETIGRYGIDTEFSVYLTSKDE
jgi:hypothetical protein